MFEEFTPATNEGDDYKPRDHYGNVVIVKVLEYRESVSTVNGDSPAVFVDLHDMTLGEAFRNVMLMGGAFVDNLKPYAGKGPLVVAWEKRTSAAGRPYAAPAAATPAQIEQAKAVYAKGDPFAPAVGTLDAEPPF